MYSGGESFSFPSTVTETVIAVEPAAAGLQTALADLYGRRVVAEAGALPAIADPAQDRWLALSPGPSLKEGVVEGVARVGEEGSTPLAQRNALPPMASRACVDSARKEASPPGPPSKLPVPASKRPLASPSKTGVVALGGTVVGRVTELTTKGGRKRVETSGRPLGHIADPGPGSLGPALTLKGRPINHLLQLHAALDRAVLLTQSAHTATW